MAYRVFATATLVLHAVVVPAIGVGMVVRASDEAARDGAAASVERQLAARGEGSVDTADDPTPQPAPALALPPDIVPRCAEGGEVEPTETRRPEPPELLGVVNVTRSELRRLLADPTNVLEGARIIPQYESGRMAGYRLEAIQPGSLFAAFGFRDGDTIATVNGVDVDSPAAPGLVHRTLPPYLELGLTRQGRPARLLVVIHDDTLSS